MVNDKDKTAIDRIFGEIREMKIEAPPYMKTRIMAALPQERKPYSSLLFWKSLALASTALCVGILVFQLMIPSHSFEALTGKPVAIKVEIETARDDSIQLAEIELPEGVTFYSEKYPELMEKRNLKLAFETLKAKTTLPIIVKSASAGTKVVRVKFYNAENRILSEKTISINFKAEELL